jgi:hypothetical protein
MKLPDSIRDLFSRKNAQEESWPSIVMLLRNPHILPIEELSKLSDAAWGMTETEGRVSPRVTDAGMGSVVFQLAPTIFFGFHQISSHYALPSSLQGQSEDPVSRMWREHTAWCAVDAPDRYDLLDKQRQECYKLLLNLVAKLWNSNVCGLYFPAENERVKPVVPAHIPNRGDLIASIKWAGANRSAQDRIATARDGSGSRSNIQ